MRLRVIKSEAIGIDHRKPCEKNNVDLSTVVETPATLHKLCGISLVVRQRISIPPTGFRLSYPAPEQTDVTVDFIIFGNANGLMIAQIGIHISVTT